MNFNAKGGRMRRTLLSIIFLGLFSADDYARGQGLESGFLNPYTTTGVRISPETITPALRKWYLPQTLYDVYGWKNWEYTNYSRDHYQRYTDIVLQGRRFYDIYGNYLMRGWLIYDWRQENPQPFGSTLRKSGRFSSWFSNLLSLPSFQA